MEAAQVIVSILGFGGAIAALIFGLVQYNRSEKWKRLEFVAKEIKEFETNPHVRNALLMIDWGIRDINLSLVPNPRANDHIRVTRETQWRALVPHPLKPQYEDPFAAWDDESADATKPRFTGEEAKIRDTYDAFLGHLERFANYVKSGLVTDEEFRPYLIYWLDSMANVEDGKYYEGDAEWRCALLTFVNYYKYSGVKFLFDLYGWNIEPNGGVYEKLRDQMENKKLYADLVHILTKNNER